MSTLTVYIQVFELAHQIYQDEAFGELMNYLAERENYDWIGRSDEELTEQAKELIKRLAKQIEELDK